jgi:polyisoprenoid-binding protein YceI
MKNRIYLLLLLPLLFSGFSIQKGKYMTNTGKISFYSSAPIENIEARNNKVTSILDTDNGSIVFSLNIKDFTFEKSLMQEHFNENYMESDKYPKSTFNGKITNLAEVNFNQDGKYNATIEGALTIHNVTKQVKATGTMEVKGGKIMANAKFPVRLADYSIEIPTIVFKNIAEVVDVTVDMAYTPYNK